MNAGDAIPRWPLPAALDRLPKRPIGPWLDGDGKLTPEARVLIQAYNDIGFVPKVEGGVIVGAKYRTREPLWEGNLT